MRKILILLGVIVLGALGYGGYQLKSFNDASVSDRKHIEALVPHFAEAIKISDFSKTRVTTDHAYGIATGTQLSSIDHTVKLKDWYKQWYGGEVDEKDTDVSLANLGAAEDLDLAYVRQIIPHYEKTLEISKSIIATTKRKEMKEWATRVKEGIEVDIQGKRQVEADLLKYPPGTVGRSLMAEHRDSPGEY